MIIHLLFCTNYLHPESSEVFFFLLLGFRVVFISSYWLRFWGHHDILWALPFNRGYVIANDVSGMPICEAFAQIEQQPNIYDVVHVKYYDEV